MNDVPLSLLQSDGSLALQRLLDLPPEFLEMLPVAAYACDRDGRILWCNRRSIDLWGRTPRIGDPAELYCGSHRLYLDGVPLARHEVPMARVLASGEPIRGVEATLERPDGSRLQATVYIEPVKDAAGRCVGAINCFLDTTDLHEARIRARQEGEHRRNILNALPAAVYTTDMDGRVTYFNQAAADLAGRQPEIGSDRWCVAWRLFEPDGTPLPPERCPMADALRERRPVRGREIVAERPDGRRVPLMPFPTPYYDEAGAFLGAVNVLVDVSELKRAEASARRRSEEQAALFRFTDRLYRADQLADVYEASLDAILEALLCERASVLLFDETGTMRFVAWRGLSTAYRMAVEGHSPWTPDDTDPDPIIIDNIDTADLPEGLRAVVKAEGIHALAFIPIVADGRVIGKFMTYYEKPHTFMPNEADLALTISRQLGFAIERTRADKALRRERELLQAIIDRIPAMITIGEPETGLVRVNPEFERLTGWQARDASGRTLLERCYPDPDYRAEVAAFMDACREGWMDMRLRTSDGRDIATSWASIALSNGTRVGIGIDITARKQAEERLRDSRAHLQLTTQAARVGTWQANLRTGDLVWSTIHKQLWGYPPTPEPVRHEDWMGRIHDGDLGRVQEALENCLRGNAEFDVEYRIAPRGQSAIRWIRSTGRAIFDAAGEAILMQGVSLDVTEQKRADEQRTLLIHELNHRVKNTLATVQSLAGQTLRGTEKSADARAMFETRLAALSRVHDVLTRQSWEGASLAEIVDQAVEPFRSSPGRIAAAGPDVQLSPKQALALSMALHELATNATKYGALSNDVGKVSADWTIASGGQAGELRFVWREDGGPPVAPPTRRGFGSRMIERSLAKELSGEVSVDYRPQGLVCTIRSPLIGTAPATLAQGSRQ